MSIHKHDNLLLNDNNELVSLQNVPSRCTPGYINLRSDSLQNHNRPVDYNQVDAMFYKSEFERHVHEDPWCNRSCIEPTYKVYVTRIALDNYVDMSNNRPSNENK